MHNEQTLGKYIFDKKKKNTIPQMMKPYVSNSECVKRLMYHPHEWDVRRWKTFTLVTGILPINFDWSIST